MTPSCRGAGTVIPPGLLAAYRRTAYRVRDADRGEDAEGRIGRRSPQIDAVLGAMGVRQGAFVTAWNPLSRPMPGRWNARMLDRLAASLRRLPSRRGSGVARGWCEAHLLVGADPRRVAVAARRFRQLAIIAVRRGAPARLVLLPRRSGG